MSSKADTVRVIDSATDNVALPLVIGEGSAAAIIWPGMGALYRSFQTIDLGAKSSTVDLKHEAESAYYVRAGSGAVHDLASGEAQDLVEGSMVHIAKGDLYRFEAGSGGLRLIGGPCPADLTLYAAAKAGAE